MIKKDDSGFDPNVRESILKIYRELPLPVPPIYEKFKESLSNSKTILITLRVKDENGEIVGYVKGAPLETYELRPGTFDYNVRKKNTEHMDGLVLNLDTGEKLVVIFLDQSFLKKQETEDTTM